MSDSGPNPVYKGALITSTSMVYEVEDFLGCGSFGAVTQCKKLATSETVAMKIFLSNHLYKDAKSEEEILQFLKSHNSDKFNIVKWYNAFDFHGHYCLEFEKLDISLHEFQQRKPYGTLTVKEIRPIAHQLATALEFLKSVRIVHADLKPVNIMMVDHIQQPLRVKLIDFGLACSNPESKTGVVVQTLWYRAPEVLIGAPFNECIDMWSLGCTLAEMLTGYPLFGGDNEFDMLNLIYTTIGKAPRYLLDRGLYTAKYFRRTQSKPGRNVWNILSMYETGLLLSSCMISRLSDLMRFPEEERDHFIPKKYDRVNFINLLKKMLTTDPAKRITPSQVLQHSFLKMDLLTNNKNTYVKPCVELMSTCLRPDDEEHQAILQTSPTEQIPNSPKGPPNLFPFTTFKCQDQTLAHKTRECVDSELEMTGGETSSQKSPQNKRKRDDAEPSFSSDSFKASKKSETPQRSPLQKRERNDVNPHETFKAKWKMKTFTVPIETSDTTNSQKSHQWKRKRDEAEPCVTSKAKKKKSVTFTAPAETSDTINSQKSALRKRKRDDIDSYMTSDANSVTEMAATIKELISNSDVAQSSVTKRRSPHLPTETCKRMRSFLVDGEK